MAITAKDVNKLRQMTGAGMMDCKKALTEANGDFDAAIDLLRKKGQKVSASRADRETTEGSVFVKANADNTEVVLITLTCETDFVAKNEAFVALGTAIVEKAFEVKAENVDALMANEIDGLSITDRITELVGKIGEKLTVSNVVRMTGEAVVPYIHAGGKLGVLVELKGATGAEVIAAGKDVGMQIAAMNPVSVDESEVAEEIKQKELEIGREQAIAEGKPEQIIEKIAQGKLQKFYKDNTLLHQQYVKDNSLTVAKFLGGVATGLTVASFQRISIG